jgi:hypothetical protein
VGSGALDQMIRSPMGNLIPNPVRVNLDAEITGLTGRNSLTGEF